jgi:hypothetical protein
LPWREPRGETQDQEDEDAVSSWESAGVSFAGVGEVEGVGEGGKGGRCDVFVEVSVEGGEGLYRWVKRRGDGEWEDTDVWHTEEKEPGLASTVLVKAADYKGGLQDVAEMMGKEEVAEYNCLEVEYFIIRTGLVS